MRGPFLPISSPLPENEAIHNARRNQSPAQKLGQNFQRVLVIIVVLFAGFGAYNHFRRLPFDSVQWKASNTYETWSIRDRMCPDLLRSDRLIGLNHAQVVALLGKPNQYHLDDWTMGYMVGTAMIDPVMLVIKFDQQKRVSECDIKTFG